MTRCFVIAVLLSGAMGLGCSDDTTTGKPAGSDGGSSGGICPNHPASCSGSCCGTLCVDTKLDAKNCGTCGTACPPNIGCVNGVCGCPGAPNGAMCPTGTGCCGAAGCKTLSTDHENCGGCGMKCDASLMCVNGKCVCNAAGLTCTGTQQCCDNSCKDSCAPLNPPDMGTVMSMPDMARGTDPMLPSCVCTGLMTWFGNQCPLTSRCIAHNCCEEDYEQTVPGLMYCEPTPTVCNESSTPQ